jgi:hypothetical protein
MSHHLDIDVVLEKLVLLQHFAAGSQSYCAHRLTGSDLDAGDGEFDEYWGWLKGIVCGSTLECAIKFRVLQDSTTGETDRKQFDLLDQKARADLTLGTVTLGSFPLTLRELSNKIIHATRVAPIWESASAKEVDFKFWGGALELSGERDGKPWGLKLLVPAWACAMQRFLSDPQTVEAFRYVGQDWFPSRRAP